MKAGLIVSPRLVTYGVAWLIVRGVIGATGVTGVTGSVGVVGGCTTTGGGVIAISAPSKPNASVA